MKAMMLRELENTYCRSGKDAIRPEDFLIILAYILAKPKAHLLAHPELELTQNELNSAENALKRRRLHEPVSYILGHKEFYGRNFIVTKDTLIPRPETEHLVEAVLTFIHKELTDASSPLDIVDIGTGSGNIIVTLRNEVRRPQTFFYGIDISNSALAVAQKNALRYPSAAPLEFLQSDLLAFYKDIARENHFLIITANLPYLSEEIYLATEKDVKDFEPRSALVSETDGLAHYYRLLEEIRTMNKSCVGTALFFEISPEQSTILAAHIEQAFPGSLVTILPDLSGRDRLIKAIIAS